MFSILGSDRTLLESLFPLVPTVPCYHPPGARTGPKSHTVVSSGLISLTKIKIKRPYKDISWDLVVLILPESLVGRNANVYIRGLNLLLALSLHGGDPVLSFIPLCVPYGFILLFFKLFCSMFSLQFCFVFGKLIRKEKTSWNHTDQRMPATSPRAQSTF